MRAADVDSERAAFLRSMAANPDDDVARLVFADWLDDRGLPQGEFVRLDLRLAGLSHDHPDREPLLARRADLLRAHADEWIAELPTLPGIAYRVADGPRSTRGAPYIAVTSWEALRTHGDELFAAVPLCRLRVESGGAESQNRRDFETVCERPWLSHVREIDIGGNARFHNTMAAALAASRYAANLVALRIRTWTGLDYRGVPALTESPHLGRLEELELSGHDIGEEEGELVANSRHLPRLVSYTSEGVQMSAASVISRSAVEAFASAPAVRLRTLRLLDHSCDARAMGALAAGAATSGLEVLDLSGNSPIGNVGAVALLASWRMTNLRELNLARAGLTDAGVRAVASAPILRGLRKLNLSGNRFTDEGATALALSDHVPDDCRVTVGWHPQFRAVTDLGLGALRERFRNLEVMEV